MNLFDRFGPTYQRKCRKKAVLDIDTGRKKPIGVTLNWIGEISLMLPGGKVLCNKDAELILYKDYYQHPDGWRLLSTLV